ncbi:MAG: hypothetical protein KR126chlam6_01216 [Candidatus Anoxychlamydiales bacterium]|nr:hypothetical protein [Candidatus Anoxychlamydiales bacterium]
MASITTVDIVGTLPAELAVQVLGNLNDPKDLGRCAQVCRKWKVLTDTQEVWRQLVDPILLEGRTTITKQEIRKILEGYKSAESFMATYYNLVPQLTEEEEFERARSDLEDQS